MAAIPLPEATSRVAYDGTRHYLLNTLASATSLVLGGVPSLLGEIQHYFHHSFNAKYPDKPFDGSVVALHGRYQEIGITPTVSKALPVKLDNVPIFEATFELRYEPTTGSMHELLPGMLFPGMSKYVDRIEQLAAASLPSHILAQDSNLWYQATRRLVGENYTLAFGPRVILLSTLRPYPGWSTFRSVILELIKHLKDASAVSNVDRCSLRYRNLIEVDEDEADQLDCLNVTADIGGFDLERKTKRVTGETTRNGFQNVMNVQTRSTVEARGSGEIMHGVLVDIDTIYLGGFSDFWNEIGESIERIHTTEKEIFFSLLTPATLARLGPHWE